MVMPPLGALAAMSGNASPHILVAGANGTLGRQVLHFLTPKAAMAATRRAHFDNHAFMHVQIDDLGNIDRRCFDGVDVVINAAGAVTGSERQLHDANVVFPVALARAAKANGVRRFVQVSSFAVYGATEIIDAATTEAPVSAYGQTKAEGDRRLLVCSESAFSVVCLRIPFLFGPHQPALIGQLLKIGRRLPLVPASTSAKRSMLTYAHAARVLCDAAQGKEAGILKAADPQPFDLSLFNRLIRESGGRPLRIFNPPVPLVALIGALSPSTHRRLFLSNLLDPAENFAACPQFEDSIEGAIRAILRASLPRADG